MIIYFRIFTSFIPINVDSNFLYLSMPLTYRIRKSDQHSVYVKLHQPTVRPYKWKPPQNRLDLSSRTINVSKFLSGVAYDVPEQAHERN